MRKAIAWIAAVVLKVALTGALSTMSARAANEDIRELPFPHENIITFASEVDSQSPSYGAGLHALLNERLGLPFSDSMWVYGHAFDHSYFLTGNNELNRWDSGVDGHAAFALLLRQWHRGNIDVFHSWHDDATVRVVNSFSPPIAFSQEQITLELEPAPANLTIKSFRHLRVFLTALPPLDLTVTAQDTKGKTVRFSREVLNLQAGVFAKAGEPGLHFLELVLGSATLGTEGLTSLDFDFYNLRGLQFESSACLGGCPLSILKLERDNFSRITVLDQLPFLEQMNVRPALLTAHGGYTFSQNPDRAQCTNPEFKTGKPFEESLKCAVQLPRLGVFTNPQISVDIRPGAMYPASHGFHSDLLMRLGIPALAAFSDATQWVGWKGKPIVQPYSTHPFYSLQRSNIYYDGSSADRFRQSLLDQEPGLASLDVEVHYCKPPFCSDIAQGRMSGLAIAIGLQRIAAGHQTTHIWPTHFGSILFSPGAQTNANRPLFPVLVDWYRRLAEHYYNPNGNLGPDQRVWVPPIATITRYLITRGQIGLHLAVDPLTSAVSIRPWIDPVTGKRIPDPEAGSRDLHGISIYVPDSRVATVQVDGRQLRTFTRNAADRSGRTSVTIVDDHSATTITDDVPMAASGQIRQIGADFIDAGWGRPGSASGVSFASLIAQDAGNAEIEFAPQDLHFFNISHLGLAYRKQLSPGSSATLSIELAMRRGGRIVLAEDGLDEQADASWSIPAEETRDWTFVTLALDQLRWSNPKRNADLVLPLGQVDRVRMGLKNARAGDRLDIDAFRGFRPDGTSVAPGDAKLLAGRVIHASAAQPTTVELKDADGKLIRTSTDRDGYYFFSNVPRDATVEVAAISVNWRCWPARGRLIEMKKNEAELDIDLNGARCEQIRD